MSTCKVIPLGKKTDGLVQYCGIQGSFNPINGVYEYFIVRIDFTDENDVKYTYAYFPNYQSFNTGFLSPSTQNYSEVINENAYTSEFNLLNLLQTVSPSSVAVIKVVANYSALPLASLSTGKFYWCENSQGTKWLPGSLGGTYYPAGLYYSNGLVWEYMETPYQASQAEVDAGINNDKFLTPKTFNDSAQLANIQQEIDELIPLIIAL